jgi:phosphatidate cytidylyltransferase
MEPPALDSGDSRVTEIDMNGDDHNTPETNDGDASSPWEGLSTRVVSSIVLGVVFLGALWQGGWIFTWLVILAALMMYREWNTLLEKEPVAWRMGGLLYVTVPCASLIWLRDVHFSQDFDAGRALVLFVVLAVAATDIGAYFAGRMLGKNKLAPVISPNKTWEGLGGGVAAAAVISGFSYGFSPYPSKLIFAILCGALLALLAQAGDLFESYIKRRVGAKDSGTLIPGHGGILDRVDGLVFTVPLFAFCVWLSGQVL